MFQTGSIHVLQTDEKVSFDTMDEECILKTDITITYSHSLHSPVPVTLDRT